MFLLEKRDYRKITVIVCAAHCASESIATPAGGETLRAGEIWSRGVVIGGDSVAVRCIFGSVTVYVTQVATRRQKRVLE